jgi:hypothetical protein
MSAATICWLIWASRENSTIRHWSPRKIAACRSNGIVAGCGGNRDPARQLELIQKGCQFITTQSDIGFLSAAASAWTTKIRDGLKSA